METAKPLRAACSTTWLSSWGRGFSRYLVWISVYNSCLSSSHHSPLKSLSLSSWWPLVVMLSRRSGYIKELILSMAMPVLCISDYTCTSAARSSRKSIISVLTVEIISRVVSPIISWVMERKESLLWMRSAWHTVHRLLSSSMLHCLGFPASEGM